jgi:hypothetical protein
MTGHHGSMMMGKQRWTGKYSSLAYSTDTLRVIFSLCSLKKQRFGEVFTSLLDPQHCVAMSSVAAE